MTRNSGHWHDECRHKTCTMCGEDKPLGEFYAYEYTTRQGKRSTRYESRCKPCARARRLAVYTENRDSELKRMRDWHEANRERVIARAKEYRGTKRGRAIKAKLQRMRKARMRANVTGPERQAIRDIYAEAMRLEDIFGVKVHVDHHIPLSKGGRHEPGNLRIMLARENLKKGASLPSHACTEDQRCRA